MNTEELLSQVDRIILEIHDMGFSIALVQAQEFLKHYAGRDNHFYLAIKDINPEEHQWLEDMRRKVNALDWALTGFRNYVHNGLLNGVSPEQEARNAVVSDFLAMAKDLNKAKDVHPAAAVTLTGATLEEFLRSWIHAKNLSVKVKKPGLDVFSQVLRDADLITRQDAKDITSWGGMRNHAAHGEWDEVADRKRVDLMIEGVNLFMRRYSDSERSI